MLPALKDATTKLLVKYNEETHPKLRILDNLIILSLVTFVVQMVYMVLVGTKEPLNALLAGVFCSLGQFALAGKFQTDLILYSFIENSALRLTV